MKIIVINGPGTEDVDSLNARLELRAGELGASCEFFRSNAEGDLVTAIQNALHADGVILNAGDYSRYSIAIRDAIASIKTPVVEVCPVNIHEDGESRHISVLSPVCRGVIAGFGGDVYFLALSALVPEQL